MEENFARSQSPMLRSSAFLIGSSSELGNGNGSSSINRAMTLGDNHCLLPSLMEFHCDL